MEAKFEKSAIINGEEEKMTKEAEKLATITVEEDTTSAEEEASSCRLFISNFPFSWTQKELRDFLRDFEPVEEIEIVYNERGSKGFGFATINDPERCRQARIALNHKIVHGRRVEVRRAHKLKRTRNTPSLPQHNIKSPQPIQELNNLSLISAQWQQAMYYQSLMTTSPLGLLNNPFITLNLLQSNLQSSVLANRLNPLDLKWPLISTNMSPALFGLETGLNTQMGLNPQSLWNTGNTRNNGHDFPGPSGMPPSYGILSPSYPYNLVDMATHSNDLLLSGPSVNPFVLPPNYGIDQQLSLPPDPPIQICSANERKPPIQDVKQWPNDRRKRLSDALTNPTGNPSKLSRSDRC